MEFIQAWGALSSQGLIGELFTALGQAGGLAGNLAALIGLL